MVTTLVGDVACVLNLVWTWNFCCKLEIVCVDGSTFVVTMPWGKIIDGELSIFFLWDLITQRLGTIISTTMLRIAYLSWSQFAHSLLYLRKPKGSGLFLKPFWLPFLHLGPARVTPRELVYRLVAIVKSSVFCIFFIDINALLSI
jgi:hypothetical protein